MTLNYRFDIAGAVAVSIPGEPELETTLNDSVTALAPAGAPQGLSTYWIDEALKGIAAGVEEVASGNMSMLLRDEGVIKPYSDYIDWPERSYPVVEIEALLRAWRETVLRNDPAAENRLPPAKDPIILPPASD